MKLMKNTILFASVSIYCTVCFADEVKVPYPVPGGMDWKGVPVVLAKGVVQVKVGWIAPDVALAPSQALSAALRAYPKSQQFRVSWEVSGGGSYSKPTVVYNRRSRTLKYFSSGYSGQADYYRAGCYQAVLSPVTDAMIHRLSTSNKGETLQSGPLGPLDSVSAGFVKYLGSYGAKIISSKSSHRTK